LKYRLISLNQAIRIALKIELLSVMIVWLQNPGGIFHYRGSFSAVV